MPLDEPLRNRRGSVEDLMQSKGTHVPLKNKTNLVTEEVTVQVDEVVLPNSIET